MTAFEIVSVILGLLGLLGGAVGFFRAASADQRSIAAEAAAADAPHGRSIRHAARGAAVN